MKLIHSKLVILTCIFIYSCSSKDIKETCTCDIDSAKKIAFNHDFNSENLDSLEIWLKSIENPFIDSFSSEIKTDQIEIIKYLKGRPEIKFFALSNAQLQFEKGWMTIVIKEVACCKMMTICGFNKEMRPSFKYYNFYDDTTSRELMTKIQLLKTKITSDRNTDTAFVYSDKSENAFQIDTSIQIEIGQDQLKIDNQAFKLIHRFGDYSKYEH